MVQRAANILSYASSSSSMRSPSTVVLPDQYATSLRMLPRVVRGKVATLVSNMSDTCPSIFTLPLGEGQMPGHATSSIPRRYWSGWWWHTISEKGERKCNSWKNIWFGGWGGGGGRESGRCNQERRRRRRWKKDSSFLATAKVPNIGAGAKKALSASLSSHL